jgi:transcriptional regulator with XRE-family HTH domain
MSDRGQDPSLYRRRLRAELRRAREVAVMTQRDVADAMDWSLSKLIRIETGTVTITTNDLRALLAHYGITGQERVDALIDTARKSRERSAWWTRFRSVVSPELLAFLGYESSAKAIRNFEPLLVPGLLQTDEYARDLLTYLRGPKDPDRIEALVRLRMERQEMLGAEGAPVTYFLMDEAVIRRVVGGPQVMRRQLLRLKEIAELPNVTIGVVPFDQGMYRGLRVPYVLFEFENPLDDDILYMENPESETVIVEEVTEEGDPGVPTPAIYLGLFWELEQATNRVRTTTLIDDALDALERPGSQVQLPDGNREITLAPGAPDPTAVPNE